MIVTIFGNELAAETFEKTPESAVVYQMDNEILAMYNKQAEKAKTFEKSISELPLCASEQATIAANTKREIQKETNKLELSILKKYGFEPVDSSSFTGDSGITPKPNSSSVSMTDGQVTYNRTTRLWRYVGQYQVASNSFYNDFADIEDVFAVSMYSDTNFTYQYSSVSTFNASGSTTGYVDIYGNSQVGSHITLRTHSTNGVIYNLIDLDEGSAFGTVDTDIKTGKILFYFKKTAGSGQSVSVKVFTSLHHNYKEFTWSPAASISATSLNTYGGSLTVSYSLANYTWQRSSAGTTIIDDRLIP